MNEADQLYDCTRRLYAHLKQGLPKKNRGPFIGQIQELLEERQQWIDRFPPDLKMPELSFSEELLEYDQAVQAMLREMSDQIRNELQLFRKKRVSSKRYALPYQGKTADGMFLDKRK